MLKNYYTLKKLQDRKVVELTKIRKDHVQKNRRIINKIFQLPKVDLHVHLGGSLRVETIIDLARQQGRKLPTQNIEKLTRLVSKDRYRDLEEYLTVFNNFTEPLLQVPEALERVAYEIAMDMARENVIYFELRFAPMNYTHKGMRPHEVVKAVDRGLARAEKDSGIIGNIILCAMRIFNKNMSPYHRKIADFFSIFSSKQLAQEVARNTAILAINGRKRDKLYRVVGFDIAGPEKGFHAKNFAEAFTMITKSGLYNTCHAGEGFGWQSIKQALVDCNVDRIGHGTHLPDNDELLEYCRGMRRIPIEVCITSNIQTCELIKNYRQHPVGNFYRNDLRVILCTDNRLVSRTTKTKEAFLGVHYHGFTLTDLAAMELNGLRSGFMHSTTRKQLIKSFLKTTHGQLGITIRS